MSETSRTKSARVTRHLLCGLSAVLFVLACVSQGVNDTPPHGWWDERGSVIPHDNFPADCQLCHTGTDWNTIRRSGAISPAARVWTHSTRSLASATSAVARRAR